MSFADSKVDSQKLAAMAKIYGLFSYDLGRVTETEVENFVKAGIPLPANWLTPDEDPIKIFTLPEGRTIAMVLLPFVQRGVYELPPKTADRSRRLIKDARSRADMVVALSPWGFTMEKEFADTSDVIPDILLGAGPGGGLNGNIMRNAHLLWVRPYPLGKTANVITILQWPQKTQEKGLDLKWVNGQNVRLKVESYSEKFQERPDVLDIMESIQDQ